MNYISSFLTLLLLCGFNSAKSSEANAGKKSFPITTLINAKWTQTPLYLEIAEYLADENEGLYWEFVKSLNELDTPLSEIGKSLKYCFYDLVSIILFYYYFFYRYCFQAIYNSIKCCKNQFKLLAIAFA